MDVVHFAVLAGRIEREEKGWARAEAVSLALRRIQREIQGEGARAAVVRSSIEGSRLQVHSAVAILRLTGEEPTVLGRLVSLAEKLAPTHGPRRMFQVYQASRSFTVLCDEPLLSPLLERLPKSAVLGVERGLATIAFQSTPNVEETPGVVALMAEALASKGINCLETVSVHSESIFVFRERDVIRAYGALAALLPSVVPATRGKRRQLKGSTGSSSSG